MAARLSQAGAVSVHYWLYVSRSTIPDADTDEVIQDIVAASQERNDGLRITGALVFSDRHFGQLIEGPAESVMKLRSSILSDARHEEIRTIADGRIGMRRFGQWALAYYGNSMVISRALQRAIRDAAHRDARAGDQLVALMEDALTQG